MPTQMAEVIDLKAYRERKIEQGLAAAGTNAFAYNSDYGQTPLSPFAMPVAFFVFWPAWVVMPHVSILNKGGSGAA